MTQHNNVIPFPSHSPANPLRRPRLLIQAARHGQRNWRRGRDLPKLLKTEELPVPGRALPRLRELEEALNAARLVGAAEYDLQRHVAVMIALLAEMQVSAITPPPLARIPA